LQNVVRLKMAECAVTINAALIQRLATLASMWVGRASADDAASCSELGF